jgi:hypothetical protein
MTVSAGSADLLIRLRIRRLEPLTGTAATEDRADLAFEGWMQLIGAIAELLGSTDQVRTQHQQPCAEVQSEGS